MFRKYRTRISIMVILVLTAGLIFVYHTFYFQAFGFSIKRSQIKQLLLYSTEHAYYVQNPKLVKEIDNSLSKLHRSHKINPAQFPEYKIYAPIPKVLIQTKDQSTYGGSLWDSGHLMNANGYYWIVTSQLLNLLHQALKDPKTKEIF